MSLIYSTRFYVGILPTGVGTNLIEVPAGHVYVIRDMAATCDVDTPGGSVRIYEPGVPSVTLWAAGTFSATATAHWTGRQVLPPGAILRGIPTAVEVHVVISGYDLVNYQ